eukprot:gene5047-15283_t
MFMQGKIARVTEIARDIYLQYMTIPILLCFISQAACTHYENEPAEMTYDRGTECYEHGFWILLIIGALGLAVYWWSMMSCVTMPALIVRSTDLAINGRYIALQFQTKLYLVVVFCLFEQ